MPGRFWCSIFPVSVHSSWGEISWCNKTIVFIQKLLGIFVWCWFVMRLFYALWKGLGVLLWFSGFVFTWVSCIVLVVWWWSYYAVLLRCPFLRICALHKSSVSACWGLDSLFFWLISISGTVLLASKKIIPLVLDFHLVETELNWNTLSSLHSLPDYTPDFCSHVKRFVGGS